MMQITRVLVPVLVVCLAVAGAAFAETDTTISAAATAGEVEPVTRETHRAYVAVGGGAALGDLGVRATGHSPRQFHPLDMDTASGSFSLRAGYRFRPWLAAAK